MASHCILVVGDFDRAKTAHRAIDTCFELARSSEFHHLEHQWLRTDEIHPGDPTPFEKCGGVWCSPGSPYRNTEGALWAIQYARTHAMPFLGSCGGYQHAILEFARNGLGLHRAGHTELDPATSLPLLARLQCPLIEQSQAIVVTDDDFRSLYGGASGTEGYHCSYGLNPAYVHLFDGTPLRVVARSKDGEARAFRLAGHPFFVGTAFQPERRALHGSLHPLVSTFFAHSIARR